MSPAEVRLRASLVVPTLNARPYLPDLFAALRAQQPRPPDEILLIDSGSTDDTVAFALREPGVRVETITNFSHGRARNLGGRRARGDIVVFLSQDALPAHPDWLARLMEPFADPTVAAVCSRQTPRPGANPMERYFLHTHFPGGPAVRRRKAGSEPTFAEAFFSNVSAAVRREALLAHPFDEELIMSEDQQLSRDLLRAGWGVVYAPESVVLHSHNYTLGVVLRRYFDSVYSLRQVYPAHGLSSSVTTGGGYTLREALHIVRRHPLWLPYYALYATARGLGALLGHVAERLPTGLAARLSLHAYYWRPNRARAGDSP